MLSSAVDPFVSWYPFHKSGYWVSQFIILWAPFLLRSYITSSHPAEVLAQVATPGHYKGPSSPLPISWQLKLRKGGNKAHPGWHGTQRCPTLPATTTMGSFPLAFTPCQLSQALHIICLQSLSYSLHRFLSCPSPKSSSCCSDIFRIRLKHLPVTETVPQACGFLCEKIC